MLLGSKELYVDRKYNVCFTEVSRRGLEFWISGWKFGHDSARADTLEGFEGVSGCVRAVSCPRLSTSSPFPWCAFPLPEVFLLSVGRDGPHIRPAEIAEENRCFVLQSISMCEVRRFFFAQFCQLVSQKISLSHQKPFHDQMLDRNVYGNSHFFS